ncbi:unnamed protein product [Haemonchus placei]|uniref:Uncharacterized protein n=1 Tax=Haemonchus placei TaxID=6290 RepID=A0A0N4VWE9_HAEPC|nr:unnamed protein product [Haemonchus placei]
MCLRRTGRMKRVEPHGSNWIYAWTLPQHISQSRFGGRRKPSSACTIIALTHLLTNSNEVNGSLIPTLPGVIYIRRVSDHQYQWTKRPQLRKFSKHAY